MHDHGPRPNAAPMVLRSTSRAPAFRADLRLGETAWKQRRYERGSVTESMRAKRPMLRRFCVLRLKKVMVVQSTLSISGKAPFVRSVPSCLRAGRLQAWTRERRELSGEAAKAIYSVAAPASKPASARPKMGKMDPLTMVRVRGDAQMMEGRKGSGWKRMKDQSLLSFEIELLLLLVRFVRGCGGDVTFWRTFTRSGAGIQKIEKKKKKKKRWMERASIPPFAWSKLQSAAHLHKANHLRIFEQQRKC